MRRPWYCFYDKINATKMPPEVSCFREANLPPRATHVKFKFQKKVQENTQQYTTFIAAPPGPLVPRPHHAQHWWHFRPLHQGQDQLDPRDRAQYGSFMVKGPPTGSRRTQFQFWFGLHWRGSPCRSTASTGMMNVVIKHYFNVKNGLFTMIFICSCYKTLGVSDFSNASSSVVVDGTVSHHRDVPFSKKNA